MMPTSNDLGQGSFHIRHWKCVTEEGNSLSVSQSR